MSRRWRPLFAISLQVVLWTNLAWAGELSWDSLLARSDHFHTVQREDSASSYALAALKVVDSIYGPRDTNVALVLTKLGLIRVQLDPSKAEQTFRDALKVWESNPGANPRLHARTLNALGVLSQRRGRYYEADSLLRRSLDLKRSTLPPNDPDIAIAYNNLAVLDIDRGRYADADRELHKAGEISLLKLPVDSGLYYINLGALYLHQFRYHDAAEAAQIALRACLRSHHGPGIVRTVHNLAVALTHLGNDLAADSLFGLIYQYFDTASAVRSEWYLRSAYLSFLIDGAQTKRELKQFSMADSLLVLADSSAASLSPPDFRIRYLSLYQRGKLAYDRRQLQNAAEHFRAAISYGDSILGSSHPDLASSHQALAETYLRMGHPDDAYREARLTAGNLYENLQALIATVPDDDALMYATQLADAVALTLRALKQSPHPSQQDLAFAADLILRTKGVTSEVLLTRHQDISSRQDRHSRELREQRAWAAKSLTDAILAGRGLVDSAAHAMKIDSLDEVYHQSSDALERTDPTFNRRVQSWKVTGRQLQSVIPANALALDYYQFPADDSTGLTDYAIVAVSRENTRLYWISAPGHIDSVVMAYAGEMQKVASQAHFPTGSDVEAFRHTSEALYHAVLGPVLPELIGKGLLLISPAGQLGSVSFSGLWSGQGQYLVETHDVAHLDAVRQLAAPPIAQPFGRGLLAVGDPDFDSRANERAPDHASDGSGEVAAAPPFVVRGSCSRHLDSLLIPLPGSRMELAGIQGTWPAQGEEFEALTGAEASEEEFKSRAPGHRIVHLATHGFCLRENCESSRSGSPELTRKSVPMNPLLRSGLLFAGARQAIIGNEPSSQQRDDGILSALEVTDMDLRGTQLVTLSSCESGLGAVRSVEGMYGLRRAFSIAGARDVLASVWQVPDAATAALMPDIYSRLDRPLWRAAREAQLQYLSRLRTLGLADHPFLWAAFVPYISGIMQQSAR